MISNFGAEPDGFNFNFLGVFLLLLLHLFLLIAELIVTDQFDDRRFSIRRNFNEVQAMLFRQMVRIGYFKDAELFTIFGDNPDLRSSYLVVKPGFKQMFRSFL